MMVQSKMNVKENDENGVESSKRGSTPEVNHWAFLEEIEAPMWADLSLESKLVTEDNDDAWFHTTHPFHHHSACHLRSAFAHPDVGNSLFNLNLQGAYTPKLPSSVSKSRGKDYKTRDWRSNFRQISFDKDHPVNDLGNTVLSQKGKSKVSHDHESEASSSITSVVDDTERRVVMSSQSAATTSGISTSTMTTVSWQRDSKVLEVSKEAFGQEGGLLDAFRTKLRKSCTTRHTRQPSRVALPISNDRESKGRKSSAGKSSVGSSSTGHDTKCKGSAVVPVNNRRKQVKVDMNINVGSKGHKNSSGRPNPGFSHLKFEVKKTAAGFKQNKDKILKVRDIRKYVNPSNRKTKANKTAEASVCSRNSYNSKIEGKDVAAASSGKEALKSKKVRLQTTQQSSLNQSRTRDQGVKGKVVGSHSACIGKENVRARTVLSQRSGGVANVPVVRVLDHKVTKLRSHVNESACSGKENVRGRTVLSQRSGGLANVPVVRVLDHKVTKLKSKNKVGVTSTDSKTRIDRMNEDGMTLLDTRVYLR